MAQRNQSRFVTHGEVDDPVEQGPRFEMDADDRQYLDNQIRGIQQHIIDNPGGGGGSGSNLGAALGVFKDVSVGVLRHRTLRVAGNLSGVEDPSGYTGEVHIRPSPPGHYNVRDYGTMVLNDSTDAARNANQAAIEAAIADMGPAIGTGASSYAGGVLYFPPGIYYLADTLTITRSIELRGHTASNGMFWAQTALCFPKGKTGIRLEYVTDSADGGRADGSAIKNIALCSGPWSDGSASGAYDRWNISTAYALGDIIIPAQWSKWGYAFECVTAGTSGTSDAFFPGKTMKEGLAQRRIDHKIATATNATPIACATSLSHGLTTGN
ncbi:MAG: Pectate lyase superfamily protein, partial [Myxococcaceae bacterium]|nr:Pectate lyase superfamily protein [Myxococcaceae bacterium]